MAWLIQSALSTDPRLEHIGQITNAIEAIAMAQELSPVLIILDHQIEGEIMGLQAAPLIKPACPDARIILFTSQDLSVEAKQEPAIDLFLPKRDFKQLVVAAQQMLGLAPLV